MEDIITNQEDAQIADSSTAQEQTNNINPSAETVETKPVEDKQIPFHEHPRFRELIEDRNKAKAEREAYNRQISELQKKLDSFEKSQASRTTQEDKLMQELSQANPEFAKRFSELEGLKSVSQELQEFKAWKAEVTRREAEKSLNDSVSRLHESYKVPKEMQEFFDSRIRMEIFSNPSLTLNDIPGLYKNIHEGFSKYSSAKEREILASYSKAKVQDASKPVNTPKTAPVKTQVKANLSKAELRAQMIKDIMSSGSAGSEI